MKQHTLYGSTQEVLSTDTLSAIAEQPIRDIRTAPLPVGAGATASHLLGIETNDGRGPRFVLKRVSAATNWIMRSTDDRRGRETLLWQLGLLDRFPREIAHCVVACAHDDAGWAILMRDVREALLPATPFDHQTQALILGGLARLHATFWEQSAAFAPTVGFCSLGNYYTSLSASMARRESHTVDDFPKVIIRGWDVLDQVIPQDLAHVARNLSEDPSPLCRALTRYPQTLVHRDLNLGNLGVDRQEMSHLVLLDWQFAGPAPPGADLGGYLSEFAGLLPCSKQDTIEFYRQLLADYLGSRFRDGWWEPQLTLSLLGEFVRLAWAYAFHLVVEPDPNRLAWWKAELDWWSEQARIGLRWL